MRSRFVAALLVLFASVPGPVTGEPAWPDTDLARHARAWFAHLEAPEDAAAAFYAGHFAADALAQVPVTERLERRRALLERSGGLTPLAVLDSTPSRLRVRARDGGGEEPVVTFEGEAGPPHRLTGLRVELGGPGEEPQEPAGPPLTPAEAAREIRALLAARAAEGAFSGAILLAHGDRILLREAWGEADRARHTPITPETRFNIASLGKILTRVAVAQLAEAGKLSLDDPLAKYLPDFPDADRITIDMLCTHTSGVGDIFNERFETMDRSTLRHNRDYVGLIRDQGLWFEPGTDRRYSNGGFVLLGEVIAKASGMDYYDYLQERVFRPAGMTRTSAPIEGDGTAGLARGYTREGAPAAAERDNAATRPARGSAAGGSYSTVDDFLALDRALARGALCGPGWSAWVCGGTRAERTLPPFGFAGGAPGISTEWMHEGDTVLIVFTNRDPEVTREVLRPLRGLVRRIGA